MFNLTISESEKFDNLFIDLHFWVGVFFDGAGFGLVGFPKRMSMGFWIFSEREQKPRECNCLKRYLPRIAFPSNLDCPKSQICISCPKQKNLKYAKDY